MEKIDYLPLGSIVYAKGGIKELMIVGRGGEGGFGIFYSKKEII